MHHRDTEAQRDPSGDPRCCLEAPHLCASVVSPSVAPPMTAAARIDASRHPLSDGCPPDWASGWGQDRYGAFVDFTVGAVTQRMRWCPPGTFPMGSPGGDKEAFNDEKPLHAVTLPHGFWLFDTPCTQKLWQAVMGDNPSHFESPDRPVEQVSWDDVQVFLSRLNDRFPGLDLTLPSEVQWEYACRAGAAKLSSLYKVAWFDANSDDQTHPVAHLAPNAWGLFDMLGNVYEWCADGQLEYNPNLSIDPTGPSDVGVDRVIRGGSWSYSKNYVRATVRDSLSPDGRRIDLGFRCARVQS